MIRSPVKVLGVAMTVLTAEFFTPEENERLRYLFSLADEALQPSWGDQELMDECRTEHYGVYNLCLGIGEICNMTWLNKEQIADVVRRMMSELKIRVNALNIKSAKEWSNIEWRRNQRVNGGR